MKHRMRDGGRAQGKFIINEKSQTPTHVHLSQGAAVVTQILWWAVVCHTVQQQAQQRAASHSLSCASFLT